MKPHVNTIHVELVDAEYIQANVKRNTLDQIQENNSKGGVEEYLPWQSAKFVTLFEASLTD